MAFYLITCYFCTVFADLEADVERFGCDFQSPRTKQEFMRRLRDTRLEVHSIEHRNVRVLPQVDAYCAFISFGLGRIVSTTNFDERSSFCTSKLTVGGFKSINLSKKYLFFKYFFYFYFSKYSFQGSYNKLCLDFILKKN